MSTFAKNLNILPHSKTISTWYKSVNGPPGILEEFDAITERVKLAHPLHFILALIYDEISIREQVVLVGSKFCGYVDLGPNISCDEVPAKEALIFVVVCINDGWKVPVVSEVDNNCEIIDLPNELAGEIVDSSANDDPSFTEFSEHVVEYIAGYLVFLIDEKYKMRFM